MAFYSRGFRDLFLQPGAPAGIFRAFVTAVAGNWHPSRLTRAWLALFFFLVRLQPRFAFVPRIPDAGTGGPSRPRAGAADPLAPSQTPR